nr:hypothetical protein [Roseateles koreensis]
MDGGPRPAAGSTPQVGTASEAAGGVVGRGDPAPKPSPGNSSAEGKPVVLAQPKPVRNGDELRKQAAQRLVAANPEHSYMGEVPAILLAIPVLEVELKRDGSIKAITVLRKPGQALETLQLAMDAVHRAAPYGDVSAMPRPWKFTETFLFNDERKFKPRTLD